MTKSFIIHSAICAGVGARLLEIHVDTHPSRSSRSDAMSHRPELPEQQRGGDPHDNALIWAAIHHSGFRLPEIAAEVRYQRFATSADLAIALAFLAAAGVMPERTLDLILVLGRLTTDARILPVRGVLPILADLSEHDSAPRTVLLPRANARDVQLVEGLIVLWADTLAEAVRLLRRTDRPAPTTRPDLVIPDVHAEPHLDRIAISPFAHQALDAAAAGGHHLLLIGPYGSGTTWIARHIHSLLPPPTPNEALTITRHVSAAGLELPPETLLTTRPFRAPHHTASVAALMGGGLPLPRPGELTLAHHGVLLLDNVTEFPTQTLEQLAVAIVRGKTSFARSDDIYVSMPTAPLLVVATMTSCPCGRNGDPNAPCHCSPRRIARHHARIPTHLRALMDLVVAIAPVLSTDTRPVAEPLARRRDRIAVAYRRRLERPTDYDGFCRLTADAAQRLRATTLTGLLTPRDEERVVRVALTLADLAGVDHITDRNIEHAVAYVLPTRTFDE